MLVNSKSQRRRCTAVADIMENGIDGPVEINRLVLKISQTRLVIENNAHAMHGEGGARAGKIRMARGTSRQLEMAVEQARPGGTISIDALGGAGHGRVLIVHFATGNGRIERLHNLQIMHACLICRMVHVTGELAARDFNVGVVVGRGLSRSEIRMTQ